jgi:glycerophosphoryl diester phosphodiesterase
MAYAAYGWSAVIPGACRNTVVFVPMNVAPWLWGWPNRFLNRMGEAGTATFVVGPYHGGDFLTGIDTKEQVSALPDGYSGGILTNELVMVAAALKAHSAKFH